jgi:hypothetical protein
MDRKEEGKMNGLLLALILGDCVCALSGISTALLFRFEGMPSMLDLAMADTLNRVVFVVAVLFSSFFVELYRVDTATGWRDIILRITYGVTISFVLLSSFYYLMPSVMLGRGVLVLALACFGLPCLFPYPCQAARVRKADPDPRGRALGRTDRRPHFHTE